MSGVDPPPRITPPAILRPSSANRHFPFFSSSAASSSSTFAAASSSAVRSIKSDGPDRSTPQADNHINDKQQIDVREKVKVEVSKGVIGQEVKKEGIANTNTVRPTSAKYVRKQKPPKLKRNTADFSGLNDGDPGSSRYDSSLGLLTKKFLNLLQQAEDGTLDLNKAAETLEVQKRRIYDITNVLEGVDLIEKKLKNRIRWKGYDMSRPKEIEDQLASLKAEMDSLHREDCRLDRMIRDVKENMQDFTMDKNNQKWLYLTKEDINNIPRFQNSTLIAVKAPHGTSVEVPDPDEGLDFQQRHYQILLRSSTGPIDCYLISNHEEKIDGSISNQNQERCDGSSTSTPEQEQDDLSMSSQDTLAGIMRIALSDNDQIDADYWLSSDLGVSITDTWGT